MKITKRIKAFILSMVMGISCLASGCEFGVGDIPTNLIFPDMGDQDIISYLSTKLLDQYRDTIVKMLTDGVKAELEKGTLDEFMGDMLESQYDTIINTLFVENRDDMVEELKKLFIGDEDVKGLLDDQDIIDEVVDSIMGNQSFKDEIMEYLMDTENEDSLLNTLAKDPKFINALIANPQFLAALTGNAYFKDYMDWVIQWQIWEVTGGVFGSKPSDNPPDPNDPKYNQTSPDDDDE